MPVHPQCQAIIDQLVAFGLPELSALPYQQVRELTLAMAADREREDVAEVRDLTAPGPGGDIPLRLYRPAGSSPGDVLGALVWFHGGGWVIGSVESYDATTRALANRSGLAVVSVDYRLAPEHVFPAAVDDCFAAAAWVVANAGSLGIDPVRVGIGGDSAGGNLAAAVALLARDAGGPALGFQLLVYPAVEAAMTFASITENGAGLLLTKNDMDWFYGHYGRGSAGEVTDPRLSPLLADSHTGLPPAHVVTAEFDPLRDEGEAYAERLRAVGVAVSHTRYDGMVHGFFGMAGQIDAAATAQAEAGERLRAALG